VVAKGDAVVNGREDPTGQALLEALDRVARQRLQQIEAHRGGHDRRRVQHCAGGRAQRRDPRQNRVAYGRGQLDAARGQRFGHEERIAARPAVELGGVNPVWSRELGHRGRRQRQEPEPIGRVGAR
jgi:hypothetical protein